MQTDRHKRLHLLATRLKDELRGTDEEVHQETKDAVPSRTYAAVSDLAYTIVSLLEDAPSIMEGLEDQEYPDYPHQSAFIDTLEGYYRHRGECHRSLRASLRNKKKTARARCD